MLHLLKRHSIPVTAFFRHSLVLTYAFPPECLKPLLPSALVLDTWRGFGSPFQTYDEARRYAGPLPYTFDYEQETNSIIGICALRQDWNPEPVSVDVCRNTFLDQPSFRGAQPILANAFHVHDVPYRWQRGRRLS